MATVLFVVKATIEADREDAYNHWYHHEHIPQVLRYNGAVSARRYKKIMGDEKYQYMTMYEFASEQVFEEFKASDHLKGLLSDYDASFGEVSRRDRFAYVQVWP
jgi:hypothetical protein